MSCYSCAKAFSLLRKEKGCPGCGFSHCSKCLDNKMYLPKLQAEAKVCSKCKKIMTSNERRDMEPPDAYYKRIGVTKSVQPNISSITTNATTMQNAIDQEILNRLQKLKEPVPIPKTTDADICQRLQKIRGEIPSTSDAELHSRLANLKGVPPLENSKPVLPMPDVRSDQEQADDLMKQYFEQVKIDTKYKDEFDSIVSDIEHRMHRLKGTSDPIPGNKDKLETDNDTEDEDEIVQKLIETAKAESLLEAAEVSPGFTSTNNELPFCEICNEDAQMRCLGCRYLYCRQCYLEHKDDDDGCNRYEPYKAP